MTKLNSLTGFVPEVDRIFIYFAEYLPYFMVLAFLVMLLHYRGPLRKSVARFITMNIGAVVASVSLGEILKNISERVRPYKILELNALFLDSGFAFPSLHASFFFAASTCVYMYHKKLGAFFIVLSSLVDVSRVISGVHYLSDVIAGALLGIFVALTINWVSEKLAK